MLADPPPPICSSTSVLDLKDIQPVAQDRALGRHVWRFRSKSADVVGDQVAWIAQSDGEVGLANPGHEA